MNQIGAYSAHCQHALLMTQSHSSQDAALAAAQESRSMDALEHKYAVQLDFGGISSEQAMPHAHPHALQALQIASALTPHKHLLVTTVLGVCLRA